jgi:tetratricopeptide (TPR) repeat protein
MKKFIIALSLTLCFIFPAAAQESKTEKQELTDRIFALYQKGDLEAAIDLGEKLVKMEKGSGEPVSRVNALVNLARIKRVYFVSLQNKLAGGKLSAPESKELREKATRNADEAEELFREALELNEKNGKEKTAQTADIKKDLAWLVSNHSYTGKKTVEKSRSRIDEAEKLLLDSIALGEQTRGREADETLFTVLDAGDFYYKYVNFEKALAFYERFIQSYGQKHGAEHADLVNALRPYASILFATFQEPESIAAIKRIEAITKKSEPLPAGEINLHLRSKESVAFSAPIIMEHNEKAELFRSRLKAQSGTLSLNNMPRLIRIPVSVEVDETGKILKAAAKTNDDKLKNEAESVVAKWTVRPFSYNGTARKLRGTLIYFKS